ncbi:HNH endonuclease [Achromobacter denitrificans]|uniref:HNH endonuclease n=1 Tax=Achromobacter denitrificans TaxID=32002 RepID=UPI003BA3D144
MNRLRGDDVRALLDYEPESGVFRWRYRDGAPKQWNVRYAGRVAGLVTDLGYRTIAIHGRPYRANRLAWLVMTNEWPAGVVDHINGHKSDDRFSNLRDVSKTVNGQNQRTATRKNRSTGLLGATFDKRKQKFRADISVNGKAKHIGYYDTAMEAHLAYIERKRELHEGCAI